MPAAIRFPASLLPPDADGYGDEEEDGRSKFQPEIGLSVTRRRYRTAVRIFDIVRTLSPEEYAILRAWYYGSIRGGEREFDDLIVDDQDDTLKWFTVNWVNEFDAKFDGQAWTVKAQYRSIKPSFDDRPSGTDELEGFDEIVFNNVGALRIGVALYGVTETEFDNDGRFANGLMYGVSDLEFANVGRFMSVGTLTGISEDSFDNIGALQVGTANLRATTDGTIRSTPEGYDREIV